MNRASVMNRASGAAALVAGAALILGDAPLAQADESIGPASASPPAVQQTLRRHKLDPDQMQAWRVPGFARVLVFTREIPDAGAFFEGALVDGHWIQRQPQAGRDGGVWPALGQAALRSRGWAKADARARRSMARDWVVNGQPAGVTVQTAERDGHPVTLRLAGRDILVDGWADAIFETRGGPRASPATGPTTYRFHTDGSIEISPPAAG